MSAPKTCAGCAALPDIQRWLGAGTQKLERELSASCRARADPSRRGCRGEAEQSRRRSGSATTRGAVLPDTSGREGSELLGRRWPRSSDATRGSACRTPGRGADIPDDTQARGQWSRSDRPGASADVPPLRGSVVRRAARRRALLGEVARAAEGARVSTRVSALARIVVTGPSGAGGARARGARKAASRERSCSPGTASRLRGKHAAQMSRRRTSRAASKQAAKLLSAAAPNMRRAKLTAVVDVDPQTSKRDMARVRPRVSHQAVPMAHGDREAGGRRTSSASGRCAT